MHSKNIIKLPAFIIPLILAFLFLPKNVFAASGVVINEIMYDLPTEIGSDSGHEWIELHNIGNTDIDLTGWKFNDGDNLTNHGFNLTTDQETPSRGSLIIPTGGFLLLAGDAAKVAIDLSNYTGSIIDTVMSLNNTSAALKILDKDNNEITSVVYDKNTGAAGNGKTLEWDGTTLKESYTDGGTPGAINSMLGAIPSPAPIPSTSPTPTPTVTDETEDTTSTTDSTGAETAYQYSKDVYLNEFLPYPAKNQKEWMEIYNAGNEIINLTGWQVDDEANSTKPQSIPDGARIKPGEFLVIELPKNILNNDGDTARLLWPDDQVVHAISYAKAKQNISYARFANGWLATNQPTPGSANKKSVSTIIENAIDDGDDGMPVSSVKIATRQDAVAVDSTGTADQTRTFQSPASKGLSASSAPNNPDSQNGQTTDNNPSPINNLSASVQDAASGSKLKTILTLSAIIIFSGLAAVGLIYFRRRREGKNE